MLARLYVPHLGKECHMRKINLTFKEAKKKKKSGVAVTGLVIIVSLGASLTLVKFFQYSNISNNDNFLISCSSRTNK